MCIKNDVLTRLKSLLRSMVSTGPVIKLLSQRPRFHGLCRRVLKPTYFLFLHA